MQKKIKEFCLEAKAENVAMLWQSLGAVAGIILHLRDSTNLNVFSGTKVAAGNDGLNLGQVITSHQLPLYCRG